MQSAGKHQIEEAFHLPREGLAISVPPDFLHAGQKVGVHVLDPYHLLQTDTSMGATHAARFHSAVRSFTDAEASDRVVHHDCRGLNTAG